VNWAIYFHDKRGGMTIEIRNEAVNDLLTTEINTHTALTQAIPKHEFRRCHVSAHLSGQNNFVSSTC